MRCPFCAAGDTKVIDSRLVGEGDQVRRRRQCVACRERFTTYESVELNLPRIIKSDGRRMPFDERKLRAGMDRALEKRPVKTDEVEAAISRIIRKLMACGDNEVLVQNLFSLISTGTEGVSLKQSRRGMAGLASRARENPELVQKALDMARSEGLGKTLKTIRGQAEDRLSPLGYSSSGVILEWQEHYRCLGRGQGCLCRCWLCQPRRSTGRPQKPGLQDT